MEKTYRPEKFEKKIYALWEKGGYFTPKIPAGGRTKGKKPFTPHRVYSGINSQISPSLSTIVVETPISLIASMKRVACGDMNRLNIAGEMSIPFL